MNESTKRLSLAMALLALGVPACAAPVSGESESVVQKGTRRASVEELRATSNALLDELKTNPELRARFVKEPEAVLAERGIDAAHIDDVALAIKNFSESCNATCSQTCGNTCGSTCGYTCNVTNDTCGRTCVNSRHMT